MRALLVVITAAMFGCGFRPSVTGDGSGSGSDGGKVFMDAPADMAPEGNPANGRRKPITIHGSKVVGSVADFPVWLDFTDGAIGSRAQTDGSDIFFTRADGVPIPYEIQHWTSGTGKLQAWVRVDQLDHNVDTVIYVRYGETGGPQPMPVQVFSSSFLSVWHCDDTLATTTVKDARGAQNGTTAGGLGAAGHVAGKLGDGIDFDGGTNEVRFTNALTGGGAHTVSTWISARTAVSFDTIMVIGNPSAEQSRWFHAHYYMNAVAAGFFGNDWDNAGTNIDNAGWTLLHWVYDGNGANTARLYRDGGLVSSFTYNAGVNTQGTGGHLGNAPINWGAGGTVAPALAGTLDEVRIATTARTPEWIATEFANQSNAGAFAAVGGEEMVP